MLGGLACGPDAPEARTRGLARRALATFALSPTASRPALFAARARLRRRVPAGRGAARGHAPPAGRTRSTRRRGGRCTTGLPARASNLDLTGSPEGWWEDDCDVLIFRSKPPSTIFRAKPPLTCRGLAHHRAVECLIAASLTDYWEYGPITHCSNGCKHGRRRWFMTVSGCRSAAQSVGVRPNEPKRSFNVSRLALS